MRSKLVTVLIILIGYQSAIFAAQDVEVPEDELAQESVYPIFDDAPSVKNRNVVTSGNIDVGLFAGLALTEPIANSTKMGLTLNYHFNEVHMLGIYFTANSSGLSRDAQGLKDDFKLDFNRAPKPKNSLFLDYNYKPFYGKLSITKNGVINTIIYGSASLGMVQYEHKSYPGLGLGIGERFYFTNHFSMKVDLRVFGHSAPIPFKKGAILETDPVPDYSSFKERLTYTTNLEVGLNYLF